MAGNRLDEFFEDDNRMMSMNRLATFLAIITLMIGFLTILSFCIGKRGADLREYLGALTTIGIIIAGLGGFNYAAGRAAGAYTDVRKAQAEQGLQPQPPSPGPTTVIKVGNEDGSAKDVNIQAAGEVTVNPKRKNRHEKR